MLKTLARGSPGGIRTQLRERLYHPVWFLGVKDRRSPGSDSGYEIIHGPPGRSYADPFAIKVDSLNYVFFEECGMTHDDGVISYFCIDEAGSRSPVQRALERPYHLSYPCVFEWSGEIFMIPETRQNRTIEIYRALRFPDEWTLERTLLSNVVAVDTTAWWHDGRAWLMCGMGRGDASANAALHLFHADEPVGEFVAHPMNPVVSDLGRARPAGKPFYRGNVLLRPAQDCAESYGRAICLNQIDVWTTDEYRERPIERIEPTWCPGCVGTHTLNQNEDVQVIDGRRLRMKLFGRWGANGLSRGGISRDIGRGARLDFAATRGRALKTVCQWIRRERQATDEVAGGKRLAPAQALDP